ncbi:hypothetical protein V3468_03285 [Flavobacterium oreochromis]|uniref:GIY-YIG domain-containing protein n=1 Tax=Flavobacterium oreochromis TaxID=2906078 RepID=A0ABW8P755_9FLAO|nr:hypothetical protein [Flavobacterium oreochromis]OWP78332.1 hypothetical protein BWG23_02335 [Flavobacterium oreochromis]
MGHKIGIWKYYHENGKLKSIGTYVRLVKDAFRSEKPIIKSVKRGVWKEFDTKENLIREKKFPSREKTLDSLYITKDYNESKERAIERRINRILEDDKYYLEYKSSLQVKK